MLIGKYFKKIKPELNEHFFSGISFNSKLCKKNHIFFAINGSQVDGNKFIKEAISNGATTIVSDKKFNGIKNGILFLYSKNVRKSLAEISLKILNQKLKI